MAGEVVRIGHAQVWGGDNVPAQMPGPASQALRPERRQPADPDDPTARASGRSPPTSTTRSWPGRASRTTGRIRHEPTREAIEGPRRSRPPRPPRRRTRPRSSSERAVVWLTIFMLSVFVGIEVISKVSSTLHTPLMSGANAIHGDHPARRDPGHRHDRQRASRSSVGLVAIVLAAVNMVGGFVVTDRMLQMFVRKKKPARSRPSRRPPGSAASDPDLGPAGLPGLRRLLHPRAQGALRARRPRAPAT